MSKQLNTNMDNSKLQIKIGQLNLREIRINIINCGKVVIKSINNNKLG